MSVIIVRGDARGMRHIVLVISMPTLIIHHWNLLFSALMIYLLAIFVPPVGLLFNGQPFAALLNLALIIPCFIFGLVFHVLLLVPSVHAVAAIYMKREERRHREIVEAIERYGPPPGWR